jgi:protoporphyrinogen oxidase
MKIGILGGGVAGVSLGRLLNQGHDITILESEPDGGGLARSFPFRGFSYDVGPHIIFSRNPAVLQYMLEIAPEELMPHERSNQIWYKGRLIKYPFENFLGLLPPEETAHCVETFLHNPYEDYKPENMLQFFLRTFGSGITDTYLRPYNAKIWKYDPAFLDLQMVGRIPKPPAEDILSGARGEFKEGYTHQVHFYYPRRGGIQVFFDKMVESLPQNAKLVTDQRVKAVARRGSSWLVRCANGAEWEFDRIINCMPLHEFFPCLQFAPDAPVLESLSRLRYNSMWVGLVVFRKDSAGHNFAFNIPQHEVLFHRISKLNFLGEDPPSESGFLFEVTFREDSPIASFSKEQLTKEVLDGFEYMGLAKREDFVDIDIRRVKYAYVIYDLLHRQNADTVLDYLRSLDIFCCGRFAEFEYVNMDNVIERAMKLAVNLNEEWPVAETFVSAARG